jgi:AhpC/TSA family
MIRIEFFALGAILLAIAIARADERDKQTIIYDGTPTEVAATAMPAGDLWVTLPELTRATKLELKPQGVCSEKQCFPLPESRKAEFVAERSGQTQFNLSAFARLLTQPMARDGNNGIWCFGPRPEEQNSHLATLTAPDFTLPDMAGKSHALSDYRGKKVLLITWASW